MKDLSVIIVSYKGWERLDRCLGSLAGFSGKLFSMEVIVVDNSGDDTIGEIGKKYPDFSFIRNRINGGFGNGSNLGAEKTGGRFLLFLNPDTVVKEAEIGKLLHVSEKSPEYYVISCRQINERGKESRATGDFPGIGNLTGFQRSVTGLLRGKKDNNGADVIFPDWVSGSVIMIRKEIFLMIGGFDEDFWMYYEDVDLCRRIRLAGGKVVFFNKITVEHNHGGSSRINTKVSSITRTEVYISKHVYINKSQTGFVKILIQLFLVINNLLFGVLQAFLGIILFFVPKVYVRTLVFVRLLSYYPAAIFRSTWVSPQSVNYSRLKGRQ